jgi:hypothetical protein
LIGSLGLVAVTEQVSGFGFSRAGARAVGCEQGAVMNPEPNDSIEVRRGLATNVYRAHVRRVLGIQIPEVGEGGALRAVARTLADVAALEAAEGLRTEPCFPGCAEEPAKMGEHWRMITAARLFRNGEALGTIFTTFVTGRAPALHTGPPDAPIPENWKPIVS